MAVSCLLDKKLIEQSFNLLLAKMHVHNPSCHLVQS